MWNTFDQTHCIAPLTWLQGGPGGGIPGRKHNQTKRTGLEYSGQKATHISGLGTELPLKMGSSFTLPKFCGEKSQCSARANHQRQEDEARLWGAGPLKGNASRVCLQVPLTL